MNEKEYLEREPSEGEQFVAEYLESQSIKFQTEVKIENLTKDSKSYRVADFYLPKYKIYIEFNGMWNNTKEDRERYREKKKVYYNNRIPCVYLYPENLGTIEFSFPIRVARELKRLEMKKELTRFQMKRFMDDRGGLFALIALMLFLLFGMDLTIDKDWVLIMGLLSVIAYQIWRFIEGWKRFLKIIFSR